MGRVLLALVVSVAVLVGLTSLAIAATVPIGQAQPATTRVTSLFEEASQNLIFPMFGRGITLNYDIS